MLGFFSGVFLAVWYRKKGPQRPVYEWMEEESSEDDVTEGDEENGGIGEEEKGREEDKETIK